MLGRQTASTELLSDAGSKDIWSNCEHYERWIMAIFNKGTNVSDRFRAYARLAGKNPSNGYPNKLVAPLSGTKKMKNLEQRRTKQQFSWEMNLQHSTLFLIKKIILFYENFLKGGLLLDFQNFKWKLYANFLDKRPFIYYVSKRLCG